MPGRLIISFDCEGKWGSADTISDASKTNITNERYIKAYQDILMLLKKYEMPATFAFSFALLLNEADQRILGDRFKNVFYKKKNWLINFKKSQANSDLDGWFCPDLLELVLQEGIHEVAAHGFCHVPFSETEITKEDALFELESLLISSKMKNLKLRTFIFPRNIIGFKKQVSEHGFLGYREALKRKKGVTGRLISLTHEFNIFNKSQKDLSISDSMVAIPSGFFLNWRSGIRKLIPVFITQLRWRSIINHAIKNNGVAHIWLHPHNIIGSPSTLTSLEYVLKLASKKRLLNEMEVLTQIDYVRSRTKA
jgi:hypothetical protein